MENSLDIIKILYALLKRWWIIALTTTLALIIGIILNWYVFVPIYEASTTLYIRSINSSDSNNTSASDYSSLLVETQLIKDYREIIKSRLVVGEVMTRLGLNDESLSLVASRIVVTSKTDTRILQISVKDADNKKATDIANKTAEVFSEKVSDIMKVGNINIIDKAITPTLPVSPNKQLNMMLAIILGLGAGVVIILLIELLDRTIKTPDDIKTRYDLPVFGVIPYVEDSKK
ncbi:MAG TPA: Wzz/FepE/Etk N-terminal domain-containing protein, partial [Clostridia bacterium]|nr:Wzz/FepE/Etk N-terminal domain-containing protein [Clostridia bacterium]